MITWPNMLANDCEKMLQLGVDVANAKIGVLGVTFKENCPDVRNSKIFDLITELESWNLK